MVREIFQCPMKFNWVQLSKEIKHNQTHTQMFWFDFVSSLNSIKSNHSIKFDCIQAVKKTYILVWNRARAFPNSEKLIHPPLPAPPPGTIPLKVLGEITHQEHWMKKKKENLNIFSRIRTTKVTSCLLYPCKSYHDLYIPDTFPCKTKTFVSFSRQTCISVTSHNLHTRMTLMWDVQAIY